MSKQLILGESPPVKQLLSLIAKVGQTKTNVLIIGESGTGKELVARMIHEHSPLKGRPFVPVNCGAIPETLIESEMFGHKKGSFTGAIQDKPGLFEAAIGGTLFLDEVGELPLSMQVKMLRALQERVIRRVGSNDDIKVDLRIIAATNRDLEAAIKAGTFREDLYYRLNVILIKTPPLRDRGADIEMLANTFLKRFSERQNKRLVGLSETALMAIRAYAWPGNIRELENVMERAVTLETTSQIELESLPTQISRAYHTWTQQTSAPTTNVGSAPRLQGPVDLKLPAPEFHEGPLKLDEILAQVEKYYLMAALQATGGVKKKAAELLGITFRSIRYRLQKQGVDLGQDSEIDD
jgi:two-component system response regulator PilR (NtrC family)